MAMGLFLGFLSALTFAFMMVFIKWASEDFTDSQIIFFRGLIQTLISAAILLRQKESLIGERKYRWTLFWRAVTVSLGLFTTFVAAIKLPLSDSTVLFMVSPMITAVLARIFLKEPYEILDAAVFLMSSLGVILVARPPLIFGSDGSEEVFSMDRIIGIISGIASSILLAIGLVMARGLGENINYLLLVFHPALALSLGIASMWAVTGFPSFPNTWEAWVIITGVGVTAFGGQALVSKGLQLDNVGPVSLITNIEIVFAYAFQIVIFGEQPTLLSITGAIIITVSSVTLGVRDWIKEMKENKKKTNKLESHEMIEGKTVEVVTEECGESDVDISNSVDLLLKS